MTSPKIVERQLAEAEAAHTAMLEQAAVQSGVIEDFSAQPAPAPAPVSPPPAPAPTAQAPATPPSDDWQHRFKTLQGMYNADAARFQASLKQYESQVAALVKQVETVKAAVPKEPVKGPEADPRDSAQFGEDMVEMVSRYAGKAFEQMRDEFGRYAASLDERVKALEARVTGVSEQAAQSLEEVFYDALTKAVPDWRQVNQNERWLAWLSEEDDVYGMTRQQALNAAHSTLNAKRVAAIFSKFKTDVQSKQETLDSQVAPQAGTASAPTPGGAPTPKLFSQRAVQNFYLDMSKGRYRGREAEATRIEAEINLAAAEGRIV